MNSPLVRCRNWGGQDIEHASAPAHVYKHQPELILHTCSCILAGFAHGLQCDIWRGPTLPGAGSAGLDTVLLPATTATTTTANLTSNNQIQATPDNVWDDVNVEWAATQAAPAYKVRLPGPLCDPPAQHPSVSAPFSDSATRCSMPWSFMLDSILPGLAGHSEGWQWSVRCWAYWDGAFSSPSGPRAVIHPAGSNSSGDTLTTNNKQAGVYLAGRQVWSSTRPGAATALADAQPPTASTAPTVTHLHGNAQLLVVEWRNVTATDFLAVSDGGTPIQVG